MTRALHLGILTQYYPPELGAPQARLSELAQHAVQAGHHVHVLTAMPSYPKGRVFEGYGGVWRKERVDNVNVMRTYSYPTQSAGMVKRLANYFSFVASSAVAGSIAMPRVDALMVESPPLFLGLSALVLAKRLHARLIFNVSDLWPQSAVNLGVVRADSASFKAAAALEALCYRRAWMVTGQSKSILSDIATRFPSVRTVHLSNGCDTTRFAPDKRTDAARALIEPVAGKFVFVYAGLHGLAQGLSQILDVAERTKAHGTLRFVLVGDGPEKQALMASATQRGLDNVRFLDPVPARDVPALLASADAIVVTLKMDIPGAVPSKIYEAMASDKPVVLVAHGEAADIVNAAGGVSVEPGDLDGLQRAVVDIADHTDAWRARAQQAREKTVQHYDRGTIARQFIRTLEAEL